MQIFIFDILKVSYLRFCYSRCARTLLNDDFSLHNPSSGTIRTCVLNNLPFYSELNVTVCCAFISMPWRPVVFMFWNLGLKMTFWERFSEITTCITIATSAQKSQSNWSCSLLIKNAIKISVGFMSLTTHDNMFIYVVVLAPT